MAHVGVLVVYVWCYEHATLSTFAVDGYDATTACCACGGGHEVDVTATPAPTTSINTLGGRYVGPDGNMLFL